MAVARHRERDRAEAGSLGRHVDRLDATEKIDGSVRYVGDIDVEPDHHLAIARSTVPSGSIVEIDTADAEAVPGVTRVVTRDDVHALTDRIGYDPHYGPAIRDQPVLALDRVRYVGEPVAAVLADHPDVAAEAADLVDVTYDERPAVTDVLDAVRDDAPIVHESFDAADTFDDLEHVEGGRTTNVAYTFTLRNGDVDGAFAAADHVVEGEYATPPVSQFALEPFAAVARRTADGLAVWTPNQSPHFLRNELAAMFDVPETRVTVRVPQVGGSFGQKTYGKPEPLVALCAWLVDGTVRYRGSLSEAMHTVTRAGTRVRLETAVDAAGAILGQRCAAYYDSGAYADIVPRMTKKSGYTATGPYETPAVALDAHCVYTNKVPSGAMRGFGVPQLVWAYERHLDRVAATLDLDPLAVRRRNAFREGSPHPTGATIESVGLRECLDRVADRVHDEADREPPADGWVRGRAVACGYKACLTPSASGALLLLNGDGSLAIHASGVEIGQGLRTTLAQVAGEALGLPLDRVTVVPPDTDTSPFDTISAGSRSTFHLGNAVLDAVDDLAAQLRAIAATELDAPADTLEVRDAAVTHPGTGASLSLADAVRRKFGRAGGTLVGRGDFVAAGGHHDPETGRSENPTVFWFWGATGAVVDVDPETGRVDVRELHSAADVGRTIDPGRVRGQLVGAAAQELGHALSESLRFEFGQPVNATALDYKVPSFQDVPETVSASVVEVEHRDGPYGATGVGETGSFAVSPAVANAIRDAVGAAPDTLPLTPERVLDVIDAAT